MSQKEYEVYMNLVEVHRPDKLLMEVSKQIKVIIYINVPYSGWGFSVFSVKIFQTNPT